MCLSSTELRHEKDILRNSNRFISQITRKKTRLRETGKLGIETAADSYVVQNLPESHSVVMIMLNLGAKAGEWMGMRVWGWKRDSLQLMCFGQEDA